MLELTVTDTHGRAANLQRPPARGPRPHPGSGGPHSENQRFGRSQVYAGPDRGRLGRNRCSPTRSRWSSPSGTGEAPLIRRPVRARSPRRSALAWRGHRKAPGQGPHPHRRLAERPLFRADHVEGQTSRLRPVCRPSASARHEPDRGRSADEHLAGLQLRRRRRRRLGRQLVRERGLRRVDISRPYSDSGIPLRFRDFDSAIIAWLSARGNVDFLTDLISSMFPNGDLLAHVYDLIVFPGHEEYTTAHEYNVVQRYRNLGGNLMFLSANNLFWKVVFQGQVMRRVGEWRNLGRPEASARRRAVRGQQLRHSPGRLHREHDGRPLGLRRHRAHQRSEFWPLRLRDRHPLSRHSARHDPCWPRSPI